MAIPYPPGPRDRSFGLAQMRKIKLVVKAKQFRRFQRMMQVLRQWNGNSVLITEGDEWLRQRRLVQPAFHPRRFERQNADPLAGDPVGACTS